MEHKSNNKRSIAIPNSFPGKLHYMLADVEKRGEGMEQCVSWAPHGRCFIIRDRETFITKVMPTCFYKLKFISFQRQLNLHGFKKIVGQGPDKGSFYHELFLRGRPDLAEKIRRAKGKVDVLKGADAEPNFYDMPPIPTSGTGVEVDNDNVPAINIPPFLKPDTLNHSCEPLEVFPQHGGGNLIVDMMSQATLPAAQTNASSVAAACRGGVTNPSFLTSTGEQSVLVQLCLPSLKQPATQSPCLHQKLQPPSCHAASFALASQLQPLPGFQPRQPGSTNMSPLVGQQQRQRLSEHPQSQMQHCQQRQSVMVNRNQAQSFNFGFHVVCPPPTAPQGFNRPTAVHQSAVNPGFPDSTARNQVGGQNGINFATASNAMMFQGGELNRMINAFEPTPLGPNANAHQNQNLQDMTHSILQVTHQKRCSEMNREHVRNQQGSHEHIMGSIETDPRERQCPESLASVLEGQGNGLDGMAFAPTPLGCFWAINEQEQNDVKFVLETSSNSSRGRKRRRNKACRHKHKRRAGFPVEADSELSSTFDDTFDDDSTCSCLNRLLDRSFEDSCCSVALSADDGFELGIQTNGETV